MKKILVAAAALAAAVAAYHGGSSDAEGSVARSLATRQAAIEAAIGE